MKPLTNGQARVLYFLREFYLTNDQLPPTHAIAAHFGWRSCNAAQEHLEGLAARGYLERNAVGKWRFTAHCRPMPATRWPNTTVAA
jgi:SOS-response transcriptional repressor LexA